MDELLNTAPCGFLAFADDGTILRINATLLEMVGYERGELQDRHVESILSVGGRVFYQTHFFPLLKLQGKAEEIYFSLRSKSGEDVPVLVSAVRRERAGAAVNDCVFVPMRQRNRYEDELLQARKAAEESNRALRVRAERETILNRIGRELRSSTDTEAIQGAAVTALGEALRVDRCYFARYDLTSNRAWVDREWHRPGLPPLLREYDLSGFDLDLAQLYRPDRALVISDVRTDGRISPKAAQRLEALGLRAGMGVGLFENGQLVASLGVAMTQSSCAWTEEQIELLEAAATQTRVAMEAARVQERERRIAVHLQEALRPAPPGKVPGLDVAAYYRPALDEAEVGGDFFDVFSLEEGRFAFVVADVSGKGLAAAAHIATVRHMLRTLLYLGTTVADALAKLNDLLTDHDLLGGFATLFAGVYDASQSAITYVCCGQEPGLLLRAATGQVEELGPTGPVLGSISGAAFEEWRVPLAGGDVLALFTDGLTEAGPTRKDLLEIPGMVKLLQESAPIASTAEAAVAHLMAGVEAFATPGGVRDDVCLLVARVEGRNG